MFFSIYNNKTKNFICIFLLFNKNNIPKIKTKIGKFLHRLEIKGELINIKFIRYPAKIEKIVKIINDIKMVLLKK